MKIRWLVRRFFHEILPHFWKWLIRYPKVPSALPSLDFPYDGIEKAYTWEDWHKDTRKKYPIRYFLGDTLPFWLHVNILARLENAFYWFRCHTYTKYHSLDLRSKEFGYKWGWIDRCEVIELANFRILQDYVEEEKPFERIDWEDNPEIARIGQEIKDLYDWWMRGRKEEEDAYYKALHLWHEARGTPEGDVLWASLNQLEETKDAKQDEMLIRLIKIRRYLWT